MDDWDAKWFVLKDGLTPLPCSSHRKAVTMALAAAAEDPGHMVHVARVQQSFELAETPPDPADCTGDDETDVEVLVIPLDADGKPAGPPQRLCDCPVCRAVRMATATQAALRRDN